MWWLLVAAAVVGVMYYGYKKGWFDGMGGGDSAK